MYNIYDAEFEKKKYRVSLLVGLDCHWQLNACLLYMRSKNQKKN